MSSKKRAVEKSDRVKLSPATIHPDVALAIRQIQSERACPLGMAIDELFWRLERAQLEIEALKRRFTLMNRAAVPA